MPAISGFYQSLTHDPILSKVSPDITASAFVYQVIRATFYMVMKTMTKS